MLKIRLQRVGKKNEPHFRLVLTEKTSSPKSKALEILGHYDPKNKDKAFKKERILHWISKGAQLSDTAFNILHNENVVEGQKIVKKKLSKKKREEAKKKEKEELDAKKEEKNTPAGAEAVAEESEPTVDGEQKDAQDKKEEVPTKEEQKVEAETEEQKPVEESKEDMTPQTEEKPIEESETQKTETEEPKEEVKKAEEKS